MFLGYYYVYWSYGNLNEIEQNQMSLFNLVSITYFMEIWRKQMARGK